MVMISSVHEEKGRIEVIEPPCTKHCSPQTLDFVVAQPTFSAMSFLALNCTRTVITLACKFNVF